MNGEETIADLHMHTPASDGTIGVERRATIASARGLEAIAITDHDIINKRLTQRSEIFTNIKVITGVEVRADILGTKIEILGYYVDPEDENLRETLQQARKFREERNREMIINLSFTTGLDLSYDSLVSRVEGNLGRPHLAEILVKENVVPSVGAAFDEYLSEEGDAFVPMKRLEYDEVIDAIHRAGGITSLAHPGRIRSDSSTVKRMVKKLASAGLDGIEVWYMYGNEDSPEYADIGVEDASMLATQFGLLQTGGSDCHGPESDKYRLGEEGISRDQLELIVDRAEE